MKILISLKTCERFDESNLCNYFNNNFRMECLSKGLNVNDVKY